MESTTTNERLYEVPFNILICDISMNSHDNTTLLRLLLGEQYQKLNTKELIQGETSYLHGEWKWLFTPTAKDQIETKINKYANTKNKDCKISNLNTGLNTSLGQLELDNTMLLVKTELIDTEEIKEILKQINNLNINNQPMTIFVTHRKEDNNESLTKLIEEYSKLDRLSFHLIVKPELENANNNLTISIYEKLIAICSYYNQLGDQYIFSKDNKEKVFTQRINIIIFGKPGCGKSTFINTLLGEKRSLIKSGGTSVTNKILQYHHSEYPLSFYDTPGFENENNIKNVIQAINDLNTQFKNRIKQIHLFLYLINSTRTLLDNDISFLRQLKKWKERNNQTNIPLLFIMTKSQKKDSSFKSTLINDLKTIQFSVDYKDIFQIELSNSPFGMKELMKWLYDYYSEYKINDAVKEEYKNARTEKEIYQLNKDSYLLNKIISKDCILASNQSIALKVVSKYCLLVGAKGFTPIPFLNMKPPVSIQITMVSIICYLYGINVEKNNFIEDKKGLLYRNGIMTNFGNYVSNTIKVIPGIGTLVGCLLEGGINAVSTKSLGSSVISYCESLFNLEALREWCLNAIDNYNSAIESFKSYQSYFEQTESSVEETSHYYDEY